MPYRGRKWRWKRKCFLFWRNPPTHFEWFQLGRGGRNEGSFVSLSSHWGIYYLFFFRNSLLSQKYVSLASPRTWHFHRLPEAIFLSKKNGPFFLPEWSLPFTEDLETCLTADSGYLSIVISVGCRRYGDNFLHFSFSLHQLSPSRTEEIIFHSILHLIFFVMTC